MVSPASNVDVLQPTLARCPAPGPELPRLVSRAHFARCVPLDPPARATMFQSLVHAQWRIVASWSSGCRRLFVLGSDAAQSRPPLTAREQAVLRLIGLGLANKEIAYDLRAGRSTIARDVRLLTEKLGSASRLDLAILAASLGARTATAAVRATTILLVDREEYMLVSVSLAECPAWKMLSARQRAIVELLLAGEEASRVAHTLGVSRRTVATQTARVFRKLRVSGRTSLVACLLGRG
jgi:DNA-binding NarL/FixJ family response regulator